MSRYLRFLIIAVVVLGLLFGLDYLFPGGAIHPELRKHLSDNAARLLPYIFRIAMLAGIAITLAVSLNLINGFTGQFSIGHAGFMAVGAYSSAYFSVNFGANLAARLGGGKPAWGLALVLATLIGAVCAGLAGLVVGVPSLRLKGDYLAIVTLGFGQIIVVFLNNIEAVGGARGYSGIPIVKSFFWIFLIAILTIVIVRNIVKSAFGRALISIREDELAAEAMGVNTTRYKVMAFVISSAMAGAGGVLLAHFDGYLNPKSFEFIKSFEILIMIILGGLGSIVGSVLGAVLLTVLPEALRGFAEYRMVIYSLLLIILMITRPQGLLGTTAAFKGWRGRKQKRPRSRTETEEITAEDSSAIDSVAKATLGERQRDSSLGQGEKSEH
ncbi:MAG: branched-chain amino acid transport system permease protein [Pyrinomonadaceae bacterium]|jgi:branched-chain amino acid transport system permease protein|nr:branched-chain amino acid transport system permease protein [Pyrinomonadaceae bacterium]